MHNLTEKAVLEKIQEVVNARSENSHVECKKALGGLPKDLWQPISAFSNSPGGGIVVLGLKEIRNGGEYQAVELQNLSQLQEQLVSYVNEQMVNPGKFYIRVLPFQGKSIIALQLAETPREQKPCYYRQVGMPNGACVREGNTNRKITDDEAKSFIRYSSNYRYDRTPAVGTDMSMLSNTKITAYLQRSAEKTGREFKPEIPQGKVLKNLGLIDEYEGALIPTLAGFMIFSNDVPQNIDPFTRYMIRCVRYAGTSPSSEIIDSQDITGTLDEQLDISLKFVLRNIAKSATVRGARREEVYEYPPDAVRELIANAVIHRDYINTGTYVSVNVFSNRIEFSNPGNLPPGITIDNLKDSQFSRNEVIARILRDLDYMEEFGRGIDLVYARAQEFGLPEPLFKNKSNMFKAILLGRSFKKLNERQKAIWAYLQDNSSITTKTAVKLFRGVSRPTVNNDIKAMLDMDLIVSKGSSLNTHYEPKY